MLISCRFIGKKFPLSPRSHPSSRPHPHPQDLQSSFEQIKVAENRLAEERWLRCTARRSHKKGQIKVIQAIQEHLPVHTVAIECVLDSIQKREFEPRDSQKVHEHKPSDFEHDESELSDSENDESIASLDTESDSPAVFAAIENHLEMSSTEFQREDSVHIQADVW